MYDENFCNLFLASKWSNDHTQTFQFVHIRDFVFLFRNITRKKRYVEQI